ncbi:roundabout homolog 2 isoform X2 [Pangasianodon hypophthalmus]|uniref:roundabout homolog 2 isoform X2 n=1 Tax=Pangasianodon hypophthalmus TaxID=310915 RepID=UPI002306F43D|nr:roundabout homolog 2 isoform X2 [Pangasianodon hypophthalmus]
MALRVRESVLLIFIHICLCTGFRLRLEDSPPRIIEDPSDLIVSKGEPATLNCKAEGRPMPNVEWYKDGEHVETDKDDPRSHRMLLPSGSLFFLRIVHGRRSKPDEGIYTCVARNYLGEAVSRNASLEVATLRDDFRQAPSDVVVAAGEPAVLECIPPRGHPEPSIYWKRNNVRVSDKDSRISMRGGKLMISHTRKSDAGMYVCVGSNMVGERDSDPAELVVFERPVFIRRPVNQIVLTEETVDFLCEVHGDPAPTIRWRREGGELPRARFEIRSDNTLRLVKVREEDEGTYTCVTENSVGRTEASATLQVHVPPQIVLQPQDQVSAQGQTVTFHCGTKGNPPPAVFWQKEGNQMLLFPGQPPSQAGRYSVSMSGELIITAVQSEDSGYYICQAISVAGSTVSKAFLKVVTGPSDRIPPIIHQGPGNQTLTRGSSAKLQCHVMGIPPPSIRWEKDGQRLSADGVHINLIENGTLHISSLQETDSGMYTCVASSSTGETRWSGTITVRDTETSSLVRLSQTLQLPGPPLKPAVTDVSQSSVTLTWQPNQHEGGAAVTSYIIEAFSQSVGNTWQTVADQVKQEKHTVSGLFPNTVYLFIVRAVNSYGLSDPSPISEPVRTQDGSPSSSPIDLRRVQADLAEVTVYVHPPEILTPTSIQITWTVEREPYYIQGYRLLYRPSGGAWLVQDIKAASKHTAVLSELHRGREYELKLRPYFKEFQGSDSELVVFRTPEEVLCGPPQAVNVVQLDNSSTVRVSWEPPFADIQDEPILEYRVWCVGNVSGLQMQLNQSVTGEVLHVLVDDLVPEILYSMQVVAVTSAGAGEPSEPVFILITPVGEPSLPVLNDDSSSLSEHISALFRQPAFIATLGSACWMVLMGFSAWIYCRHKRRKELGHYATSFAYTPAVGLSNGDGSGLGRPCLLGSNMANYPWLADSWPNNNFNQSSKDSMNCCTGKHDSTDRYYNTAGTNFLRPNQACSPTSNEGAIYSTIDRANESQHDMSSVYSHDLYTSSPVLSKPDLDQWSLQSDLSTAEYAQLQYPRTDNANVEMQKPCESATYNWSNVLSLPPPNTREQRQQPRCENDEDWCAPLPERTYRMEGLENAATLPLRGERCGRATTYSQPFTATLNLSPNEERMPVNPCLRHPDLLLRIKGPCAPNSKLTPPNPNLLTNLESHNSSLPRLPGHWRDICQADRSQHLKGDVALFVHEKSIPSPTEQPRSKKTSSRDGPRRRETLKPGDLPPPPEPPPGEGCQVDLAAMSKARTQPPSREWRADQRTQSQWSTEDEELIHYSVNMQSRNHMSSRYSPPEPSSSCSHPSTASHTRRKKENV